MLSDIFTDKASLMCVVLGCADVSLVPDFGWFRRSNETHAVIGCWYNDVTWDLRCLRHGGSWAGSYGNCTSRTYNLRLERYLLSFVVVL